MNVLGIHVGHDSSAALVRDGRILADAAEERFTRVKHYCGLPVHAVEYCLRSQGLSLEDIDVVAIPTRSSVPALDAMLVLNGTRRESQSRDSKRREAVGALTNRAVASRPLYHKTFPLPSSTGMVHVEHHLAHAASAYYTSGTRDRQLIATLDGAGDDVSIGLWRGENGRIERLQTFPAHASLGWFYSNVTEALGWWHGDGEGKTMALASYGDRTRCAGVLDRFAPRFEAGELVAAHDFGRPGYWNERGALEWHFDEAREIRDLVHLHGAEHIAAEAQHVLEEQVGNIIYPWMTRIDTRNCSAAGGVMLNVKLNQRLWESGRIDRHHTYPNPGDAGLAAGAALFVYFQSNPDAAIPALDDLRLGPEYGEAEVEADLRLRRIAFRRVDDPAVFAAGRLADGRMVAWFQGRMESGPRALGARSILMSANRRENKDVLNARVKFREAFRPFCPSLLWEHKDLYLEHARDECFMMTSFTCKPDRCETVPAVVHADRTVRPQTVKQSVQPQFWNLINEFGRLTGQSLVLNTSFNVAGDPIVCHPRDAIRCFYDSGLDVLVMGNLVIEKPPGAQ